MAGATKTRYLNRHSVAYASVIASTHGAQLLRDHLDRPDGTRSRNDRPRRAEVMLAAEVRLVNWPHHWPRFAQGPLPEGVSPMAPSPRAVIQSLPPLGQAPSAPGFAIESRGTVGPATSALPVLPAATLRPLLTIRDIYPPSWQGADPDRGLSTGVIVALVVGIVAATGGMLYFVTR